MADSKEAMLFSGDKETYHSWKRWALAKLYSNDKIEYDRYGATVFTWLRGKAAMWFEDVDIEDLNRAGGHLIIFEELDRRFPEKTKRDKRRDESEKEINEMRAIPPSTRWFLPEKRNARTHCVASPPCLRL